MRIRLHTTSSKILFAVFILIPSICEYHYAFNQIGSANALMDYAHLPSTRDDYPELDGKLVYLHGEHPKYSYVVDPDSVIGVKGYLLQRDVHVCQRRIVHRDRNSNSPSYEYYWNSVERPTYRNPYYSTTFYRNMTIGSYTVQPYCNVDKLTAADFSREDVNAFEQSSSSCTYKGGGVFIFGRPSFTYCSTLTVGNVRLTYTVFNPIEISLITIKNQRNLECPPANYTGITRGDVSAANVLDAMTKTSRWVSRIVKFILFVAILLSTSDGWADTLVIAFIIVTLRSFIWKGGLFSRPSTVFASSVGTMALYAYKKDKIYLYFLAVYPFLPFVFHIISLMV